MPAQPAAGALHAANCVRAPPCVRMRAAAYVWRLPPPSVASLARLVADPSRRKARRKSPSHRYSSRAFESCVRIAYPSRSSESRIRVPCRGTRASFVSRDDVRGAGLVPALRALLRRSGATHTHARTHTHTHTTMAYTRSYERARHTYSASSFPSQRVLGTSPLLPVSESRARARARNAGGDGPAFAGAVGLCGPLQPQVKSESRTRHPQALSESHTLQPQGKVRVANARPSRDGALEL